ncbi:phospholipase A2-like [Liolophura sinensis]|uniref:phospholipase A2-like n=1 Tax=Liolophura sinensis TaxID=3198878 RepID=UPI003158FADF
MMIVTALVVAFLYVCSVAPTDGHSLFKRRLDQFGEMVHLKTGRDSLDYNSYGNYCGIGGGNTPVDNIDRCCKTHDACYYSVNRNQCSAVIKLKPYLEGYTWHNNNGQITCSTQDEQCRQATCHCDKEAAECFGRYKDEYNRDNLKNIGKLLSDIQHLLG